MYTTIFQNTDHIIYCSETLLRGDCGQMTQKQMDFLQKIIINTRHLNDLCVEFEAVSSKMSFGWDDIAKVRHELSNPITPILAYSELMLMGKVGELSTEQREGVHAIFLSACSIREVVEELVEQSRRFQAAHSA